MNFGSFEFLYAQPKFDKFWFKKNKNQQVDGLIWIFRQITQVS